MECFKRGGEKRLAEIRNSRHSLICSNRKSRPSLLHRPAFRFLGTLSAPRFRSVLSHKNFRRELRGLYNASLPLPTPGSTDVFTPPARATLSRAPIWHILRAKYLCFFLQPEPQWFRLLFCPQSLASRNWNARSMSHSSRASCLIGESNHPTFRMPRTLSSRMNALPSPCASKKASTAFESASVRLVSLTG